MRAVAASPLGLRMEVHDLDGLATRQDDLLDLEVAHSTFGIGAGSALEWHVTSDREDLEV